MRISEFALKNNVTAKMLRHYDEMGLLKPMETDQFTGYRLYTEDQSKYVHWINILKNLNFSLTEIKTVLDEAVDVDALINTLKEKRIGISTELNNQIQKKIQIDTLIKILEKEGFAMDKKINLMHISDQNVNEIKKNMPNMEMFIEEAGAIMAVEGSCSSVVLMRVDLTHFKSVNDNYGHDVGDKVIVAVYQTFGENIKKLSGYCAVGRCGGDEFIACFEGNDKTAEAVAESFFEEIKSYDFSTLGCPQEIGCYLAAIVNRKRVDILRKGIEQTVELLEKAKEKGRNSLALESML